MFNGTPKPPDENQIKEKEDYSKKSNPKENKKKLQPNARLFTGPVDPELV